MKGILIILFGTIIFTIISCNENSFIEEPKEYEPLIPLNVGNYWLYRAYQLNPDGSGGTPSLFKTGFIIDGTLSKTINNEKLLCYKLFNCGEELKPFYDKPGSFVGSKLIYQNKSGVYYSGNEKFDTLKVSFNDLIFPYPVEKGKAVNGHVFYYSNSGNFFNVPDDAITQYTCVSTDSVFTTPFGDFRCIVYKMAYLDLEPLFRDEVYYFIKPDIGIVGMVNMVYHYNLKKYSYMGKTVLTDYKIK